MSNEPSEPDPARQNDEIEIAFVSAFGGMVKWIMASLLVVNGGAILALSQIGAKHNSEALSYAAGFFISGIVSALISGMASAIFLVMAMRLDKYLGLASVKRDGLSKAVAVFALSLSVINMVLSMLMFIWGARAAGAAFSG